MNQQNNTVNNKYKTSQCRHWETTKGCQMGEKCRFAHGTEELRNMDDPMMTQVQTNSYMPTIPNSMNYKSMKCYYYEKDNYCKYGNGCPYAHSDQEIKSVDEISYLSTLATAYNNQLTHGSSYYYNNYNQEQQDYFNYINNMNNMNQMNTNNQNVNNYTAYDYSYTPDTNYGTGTNKNEFESNPPNKNNQFNSYYYDPNYQPNSGNGQ